MGIKNFFHKIKIGFARLRGKSIPKMSSTKRYGDNGEDCFIDELKRALSFLRINPIVYFEDKEFEWIR